MISLCMDTSHKKLVLVLIKDGKMMDSVEEDCFKKQSEVITSKLDEMLKKHGINPLDVNEICVTKGPGSYTGVRIAMTIAKVMGAMGHIPVYTLSSLQLNAGLLDECLVLLDARSKRAYYGLVNHGELLEQGVDSLDALKERNFKVKHYAGDAQLLECNAEAISLAESFVALRSLWQRVENIHSLAPEYLKSNEDYLVKK